MSDSDDDSNGYRGLHQPALHLNLTDAVISQDAIDAAAPPDTPGMLVLNAARHAAGPPA
jgi:hypothetical protein